MQDAHESEDLFDMQDNITDEHEHAFDSYPIGIDESTQTRGNARSSRPSTRSNSRHARFASDGSDKKG